MEGGKGYPSTGSLGRWCADSARYRLLGSLGLGVLGVLGAVLIGRRNQPPAAPQTGPAPA
jgi:hypothetical protein